jgi:uncharacterized protein YndB with AHSA1/START domain
MTSVDEEVLSLQVVRRFDASPERVFDAWLSAAWADWLPPGKVRGRLLMLEPRVGGRYEMEMTMPDGRLVRVRGRYLEIDRPHRLLLSWLASHNEHETLLSIDLQRDGAGTLLTLRHDGFPDTGQRDRHRSGWDGPDGALDKLAGILRTRKKGDCDG